MRSPRSGGVKGTACGAWAAATEPESVPSTAMQSRALTAAPYGCHWEFRSGTGVRTDLALPVCPSLGTPRIGLWWGVSGPSEARRPGGQKSPQDPVIQGKTWPWKVVSPGTRPVQFLSVLWSPAVCTGSIGTETGETQAVPTGCSPERGGYVNGRYEVGR